MCTMKDYAAYTIKIPPVHEYYVIPAVKKVLFNGTTTIVFFDDGTKTVAKLGKGETYDCYAGFMACVCKKMFGGTSAAKKLMWELESDNLKEKEKKEKAAAEKKKKEEELYKKKVAKKAHDILVERDALDLIKLLEEESYDV